MVAHAVKAFAIVFVLSLHYLCGDNLVVPAHTDSSDFPSLSLRQAVTGTKIKLTWQFANGNLYSIIP